LKPWSPYWGRFPSTRRLGMKEEYEGMIRTRLYDEMLLIIDFQNSKLMLYWLLRINSSTF
jgi:hypothetical protein